MNIERLLKNFGVCENCIKKACLAMLSSWLIVGLSYCFDKSGTWLHALTFLAIAFTALWATHLVAFGIRTTKGTALLNKENFSRRRFVGMFLKTAGFAALVSLPMAAHAWSACGGWKSGDCHPCARRMTADSPCYSCRSCGSNCGDGQC